ncbi:uncharacterized protein MCYG_02333 [Microsporum canis CBS 113480]|uniref:Uncharacterized protein n=1 Tax=Arthroderma otae (strain ATCC MYA-4605 / CBS 113480) TaxID=554155 RepID=C5FJ93_ARTOC|nr:uncharacterized protein MCYG_02333 [Microsporum canis CBS 113480]EEQ29514.1 predicted protein [Microsporum canis CBS 113480]
MLRTRFCLFSLFLFPQIILVVRSARITTQQLSLFQPFMKLSPYIDDLSTNGPGLLEAAPCSHIIISLYSVWAGDNAIKAFHRALTTTLVKYASYIFVASGDPASIEEERLEMKGSTLRLAGCAGSDRWPQSPAPPPAHHHQKQQQQQPGDRRYRLIFNIPKGHAEAS